MTPETPTSWPLKRLAESLAARSLSPVELTEMYLRRIQQLQPRLNAFITVTAEQALSSALQAERELALGDVRGPLHGIPITLKDLIDTAGIRTTSGSKILANNRPAVDAAVARRLAEAGAILLGKTNLHEFAFGVTSVNEHYGAVCNPWNPEMIAGGSSGGSAAAVIAGMCAASLGTDTGGSIRIPASACGCVGLKPTYGRISRRGVFPLSWSMDHVGPITRTVQDAAILLELLTAHDPADPGSSAVRAEAFGSTVTSDPGAVRLGICRDTLLENLHPEVEQCFQTAVTVLEKRFGRVREVQWPLIKQVPLLGNIVAFAEAASVHEEWVRKRPEDYSREVLSRLRLGMTFLATDYLRAQRIRSQVLAQGEELFRDIDLLVYPTLPFAGAGIGAEKVPTGSGEEDVRVASIRLNRLANLTGYPAISIPCGLTERQLPVGLQLMAAPFRETLLLQVACWYEQETGWINSGQWSVARGQ